MLSATELKNYNLLGVTSCGIKLFYQDNKIYILFMENSSFDASISFFLHIYEQDDTNYYKRDFKYSEIKRDLPDDKMVIVNNVKRIKKLEFGQWNGKKAIWRQSFIVPQKVLFHIDHYGGLVNMIALRYLKHKNDLCFLIASIGNDEKSIQVLKLLEEYKIFHEIITICPNGHSIMHICDKEILKRELSSLFDTYLALANIDLGQIFKTYSAFDINGLFTLYLDIKMKSYYLVELGTNQFKWSWRKTDLLKHNSASIAYNELLCERGITEGLSKQCLGWICFEETISQLNVYSKPVEFINFSKEIKKFSKSIVESILIKQGVDVENLKSCTVMILPNSKYMMKDILKDKWEDDRTLARIYTLLADYYGNIKEQDKIIFKPHPLTDISFNKYVPNVQLLPKEIPIEIINVFENMKIQQVLAINTTAVEKIKDCIIELVEAKRAFVSYMNDLHILWYIFNVFDIEYLEQNIYEKEFFSICRKRFQLLSLAEQRLKVKSAWLVKEYQNENDDVIFVVGQKCCHAGYESIFVKIEICPFREMSVIDSESLNLTILCKDNALVKKIVKTNVIKRLYCSGAEIRYFIVN